MNRSFFKKLLPTLLIASAWYGESFSSDEEFRRAIELSKETYEIEKAKKETEDAELRAIEEEFKKIALEKSKQQNSGTNSPKQNQPLLPLIESFQGQVNKATGIKLSFEGNDEDTLFGVEDNQLNHNYGYGNHALMRENSSGKNNCCFLFSIIGDNEDLLTKVMGSRDQAKKILSDPELANTCDEDAHILGLKRRDFSPVREKFMNDILKAMEEDRKFYLGNGEEESVRNYVNRIISTYNFGGSQMKVDPKGIHETEAFIPVEYATLFSVLYDTPVVPLNKANKRTPILMNPLVRERGFGKNLMPNFEKDKWNKAIFIYHSGVHYQKLHVLN